MVLKYDESPRFTEVSDGEFPPGGLFGVLQAEASQPAFVHKAPQMEVEILEKWITRVMIFALQGVFLVCLSYSLIASSTQKERFNAPPAAAAAAQYGTSIPDLIGVANYQPFVDASSSRVFNFSAAATVLPPDVYTTSSDGNNYTAVLWFGTNSLSRAAYHGSRWNWVADYHDESGIPLSGENIRFNVLAYVCWSECETYGSWHLSVTENTPYFSRKVQVREKNAAGVATSVRWELLANTEFTPSHENYCISFLYLNDPGGAGYRLFSENQYGEFGSCENTTEGSKSCMRITQIFLSNQDFMRNWLALASFMVTALGTIIWVAVLYRAPPRGLAKWNAQQIWTLAMAVGIMLYQNPIQSSWLLLDSLENRPHANRALEAITEFGIICTFLVAALWADCARHQVLSVKHFYVHKIIFALLAYGLVYMGLFAIYPVRTGDGYFWATSVWSWPSDRAAVFVVSGVARLLFWLAGGFFYFYFLHRSFKFYDKVPYLLTRAEQLSFRFVVYTLSLFVGLTVLLVGFRFCIAVIAANRDYNPQAAFLTRAAAFFKFLYGESIRSPLNMAFLGLAVLVFEFAFMPVSAAQLAKHKPKFVRLERDLVKQGHAPAAARRRTLGSFWRQRSSARQLGHGSLTSAHSDSAVAATAADLTARMAPSVTVSAAATDAPGSKTEAAVAAPATRVAAQERPLFVVERARWLASIAREAYRCFSAEELAARTASAPQKPTFMMDVAPFGCEVVATLTEAPGNNLHDTHVLIARHRATRRLVVAFRGTVSKKQMKTDLQGWPCSVNLDLLALRSQNNSMFGLNRSAKAKAAENPVSGTRQAERPAPSQVFKASNGSSLSSRSYKAHIANEDQLPGFLVHLANILKPAQEPESFKTATVEGRGTESEACDILTPFDGGPEAPSAGLERSCAAGMAEASAAPLPAACNNAIDELRKRAADLHSKRVGRRMRELHGRVHYGFWSSYSTVRERVLAIVQEELLREPGQVYITGHSLGGALCTLCAYDIALWLLPLVNAWLGRDPAAEPAAAKAEHEEAIGIVMYNFGSPRVGDRFFAERYNGMVKNSYRVVCDGDVVTGVPPARMGYVHIGGRAVVDPSGVLIDPSALEKRFKTSMTLNVAAHRFDPYMAALDGCLYPLQTKEDMLALIDAVYRDRARHRSCASEWYGCASYWLCCDSRLQTLLCCHACRRKSAESTTGSEDDKNGGDNDADVIDMVGSQGPPYASYASHVPEGLRVTGRSQVTLGSDSPA